MLRRARISGLNRSWLLAPVALASGILFDLTLLADIPDPIVRMVMRWLVLAPVAALGVLRLSHMLVRAAAARRETEDRYRRLVELCPDPIIVHCDATIVYANPATLAMAGATNPADLIGHPILEFIHPDFHEIVSHRTRAAYAHNENGLSIELTLVRPDGQHVEAEASSILTTHAGRPAMQVIMRDITERKRAETALVYQAQHDALTGLPNRTLLLDKLRQAIASDAPIGLLLLDLDGFKEVNDTLGHHAGDALLQQVGARLRHTLREADCIARLGGDEFAAIVPAREPDAAAIVARNLLRLFQMPYEIEGQPIVIGASIGIAQSPEHGNEADTLLRRADVAMYVAKRAGAGMAVYAPDQDQHSPDRLTMIGDLRRAIEENELVLHYQPKIDLRTGALNSVEALVRWPHPLRGLIAPDQFISVAEQSGLIDGLSRLVLRAALRQIRAWRRSGVDIRVAVNLSARNLLDQKLPDMIGELLAEHGLPAELLGLEITESTLMADPTRALAVLGRLRDMGIGISIDDFGTGHSSLAYLKRLPVSELKIDRSFVRDITHDESDRLIVRAMIDLAHSLGLRVVAEGVEDLPTQLLLTGLGCDIAQGYFLSHPLRGPEVTHWLFEQSAVATRAA
jgi:diguanylate cyclase (GGDEF)-like protein/PAS domain S-box-containing protein